MKIFSYWQSNNRQNENYFYLLHVQKREINVIHSISFKNQPYFKKGANTKMIFISSKLPLAEIEILTPNEIRNKTDWFLFDCQIRNKKYWKDDNLYHMYNRLYWYPIFYKDKLYNYLMSDNYYFRSNLYKMMENHAQIIYMRRVKNFDEIKDYDREVIKQEDRILGEEDIKKMFNYFERNNFKENPICEYVFG